MLCAEVLAGFICYGNQIKKAPDLSGARLSCFSNILSFTDPGSLAAKFTQVVKLCTAYMATGNDVDCINRR